MLFYQVQLYMLECSGGGGAGEQEPRKIEGGRGRGGEREMCNANFLNLTMHYNTFKTNNSKYI